MRFRRQRNYMGVIIGEESGSVIPLPWCDFFTEEEAQAWVQDMNRRPPAFTHFEYRPIEKDEAQAQ
jgi:hypothetical protein